MNRSNFYIFMYASVMVIIVAAILSLAATGLKPFQDLNEEIAKKLDILNTVGQGMDAADAESKNDYVEAEYDKFTKHLIAGIYGAIHFIFLGYFVILSVFFHDSSI